MDNRMPNDPRMVAQQAFPYAHNVGTSVWNMSTAIPNQVNMPMAGGVVSAPHASMPAPSDILSHALPQIAPVPQWPSTSGTRYMILDSSFRNTELYPDPAYYEFNLGQEFKGVTSMEVQPSLMPKANYCCDDNSNELYVQEGLWCDEEDVLGINHNRIILREWDANGNATDHVIHLPHTFTCIDHFEALDANSIQFTTATNHQFIDGVFPLTVQPISVPCGPWYEEAPASSLGINKIPLTITSVDGPNQFTVEFAAHGYPLATILPTAAFGYHAGLIYINPWENAETFATFLNSYIPAADPTLTLSYTCSYTPTEGRFTVQANGHFGLIDHMESFWRVLGFNASNYIGASNITRYDSDLPIGQTFTIEIPISDYSDSAGLTDLTGSIRDRMNCIWVTDGTYGNNKFAYETDETLLTTEVTMPNGRYTDPDALAAYLQANIPHVAVTWDRNTRKFTFTRTDPTGFVHMASDVEASFGPSMGFYRRRITGEPTLSSDYPAYFAQIMSSSPLFFPDIYPRNDYRITQDTAGNLVFMRNLNDSIPILAMLAATDADGKNVIQIFTNGPHGLQYGDIVQFSEQIPGAWDMTPPLPGHHFVSTVTTSERFEILGKYHAAVGPVLTGALFRHEYPFSLMMARRPKPILEAVGLVREDLVGQSYYLAPHIPDLSGPNSILLIIEGWENDVRVVERDSTVRSITADGSQVQDSSKIRTRQVLGQLMVEQGIGYYSTVSGAGIPLRVILANGGPQRFSSFRIRFENPQRPGELYRFHGLNHVLVLSVSSDPAPTS